MSRIGTAPATIRSLGWAALAVATHWAGRVRGSLLEAPPLLDPAHVAIWWQARGPVVVSFAMMRACVELGAGYLAVLWCVAAVASGRPAAARVLRMLGGCRAPGSRRAIAIALGAASVTAGVAACSTPAAPAHAVRSAASAPVEIWLGPILTEPRTARSHATSGLRSGAESQVWTVRPGDNLWSIAESALARVWGFAPTVRETSHYWLKVIDTNRNRLPDPANPNLLFPGDRLILPVIPGEAGSQPGHR